MRQANFKTQIKRGLGRYFAVVLAIAIVFLATPAFATIQQRLTMIGNSQINDQFVQELDLTYIQRLTEIARGDRHMSIADFVPTNIQTNASESSVAKAILGHTLERWFSTSTWARDNIGEAMKAMEAPFEGNVSLKDATGVTHRLQMGLKAARAIASVTYSGWVDASVAYQVTTQTLGLEVSRKVAENQKVILNIVNHPDENRQILGYQIEW